MRCSVSVQGLKQAPQDLMTSLPGIMQPVRHRHGKYVTGKRLAIPCKAVWSSKVKKMPMLKNVLNKDGGDSVIFSGSMATLLDISLLAKVWGTL